MMSSYHQNCIHAAAAAAAKSLQSWLCNPIDGSPSGSPVPGILQAGTLEWVAISFSNAWKCKVKVKSLSRFRLFATPWTAAYQAPLSMGFSRQEYWSRLPLSSPKYFFESVFWLRGARQEYWSGLPCPPPGILGIKSGYLALQVDSLPTEPPWKLHGRDINSHKLMCRIYTILSNFTWYVCV